MNDRNITLLMCVAGVICVLVLFFVVLPGLAIDAKIRHRKLRVRTDMHSIATAIEQYRIDNATAAADINTRTLQTLNLTTGSQTAPTNPSGRQ